MVKNNKEVNRTLIVALVIIAIVLAFQFGRSSEKLNKKSGNMTITSSEQVANIDKVNKATGEHIDVDSTTGTLNANPEIENLELTEKDEIKRYNNIQTKLFTFIDNDGNEKHISDGSISIENIVKTVDSYLETTENKVVGIGIVGSKLYIQEDTRIKATGNQKVNIVTFETGLDAYDFIQLTESIYDLQSVNCQSLFSYKTTNGDRHLIYVYEEPVTEEPVTEETVTEEPVNLDNNNSIDK